MLLLDEERLHRSRICGVGCLEGRKRLCKTLNGKMENRNSVVNGTKTEMSIVKLTDVLNIPGAGL